MATGQGNTWVLVADAHRARIFDVEDAGLPPRLRTTIQAGKHGQAVGPSGAPLPEAAAHGAKPRKGEKSAPHLESKAEQDEKRYAGELVRVLERGLADNHFKHLVLVAEPRLLGMLRESLTRGLAERLEASTPKDWSHITDRDLVDHVRPLVQIWPQK
jgi:protein required for attachment to host cells